MATKKQRVIAALSQEFNSWSDGTLDDFARTVLELPQRPEGNEPYGWLLPQTKDNSPMLVSQVGIALIKKWEGFRAQAYLDPVGVWTIGYGHTHGVKPGHTITEQQALQLLELEVQEYANAVKRLVTVPVNQNQFNALTSFAYNVGVGALSQSTLLELLNQRQYQAAADQFLRWVKGGGQTLPGLVSRRQDERKLFLS